MRNIKLTIEYDGTHFNGWQIQTKKTRTVQGEIEKALKRIFKKNVRVTGSGRTDSGVHALGQVAHFKTDSRMTPAEILKALNAHLPEDVVVLESGDVPAAFHAQYHARKKTYRYVILNRETRPVVERRFCLHVPVPLNLRAMRRAAQSLVGKHDFRSFMASDPARRDLPQPKDTVRTVTRIDIRKRKDTILVDMEANGFLYKMVRNIVGTLLTVGTGKTPAATMPDLLGCRNRALAGKTAAARGLFLLRVDYEAVHKPGGLKIIC